MVSSGMRDVMLVTHICSHSAECLFANFCNQTWYCGAPPSARMSCKKMGFYLQGQGHSVGYIITIRQFLLYLLLVLNQ